MQRHITKIVSLLVVMAMLVFVFAGCTVPEGTKASQPAAASAAASSAAPAAAASSAAPAAAASSAAPAAAAAAGFKGSPDEAYYMIVFVSGVEYWFPVYAGFKQAAKELGVQCYYTGCPEYEASKEVDVFNQVLAKNPKGIYLSPITAEAFKEPIDRAIDQGIVVATFASDSPDSKRPIYITSNNVNEGQYAARQMAKDMGGKGKVMTLRNPGQTNHDIRVDTFRTTIKNEFPDIQLLDDVPTNQDPDKAYTAVMTVAQKNPDLGGVFMPEANSGMGAARAAKELGSGIRVLCCDVNKTILDMIKAGEIWGAIDPNQGCQGYMGMITLFIAAHPELTDFMAEHKDKGQVALTIPYLDNSLTIVNKDNADYYYTDKYATRVGYKSVEDMLSPYVPGK